MTTSPTFNLWTDPWIRVIRNDWRDDELSIRDCLAQAHELAALSDPSPPVVGGTHRLLAAILQAIYQPGDLDDIAGLIRAGRFDHGRLQQFGDAYAQRFDLFDPEAPFLQTGDVPLNGWQKPAKGKKQGEKPPPVARLFAEVPVATERTHFHHVTDEDHRLCPACCARGLVTVPSFATASGRSFRPLMNSVSPKRMLPIYVLPAGDNLFETLALALIADEFQPRTADPQRRLEAIWTTPPVVEKGRQVTAVGYLESLTFPARRMRLYPSAGPTSCTHCGQRTDIFVTHMLFEMGHWRDKKAAGVWEDPFVAFRAPQGRSQGKDATLEPVRPEEGKAVWREYANLLLEEDAAGVRPRVVQQVARLIDRGALADRQSVRFRCIGIRNEQAKIFEWLDEALEAPPSLLTDLDAAGYISAALQQANEGAFILQRAFNRHFRPERSQGGATGQDVVRFTSVRERMIADYWRQLGLRFRQFINELRDPQQRDRAARNWARTIVDTARRCFDAALEQIGSRADALRARVEAKNECDRRLYGKRKEWLNE